MVARVASPPYDVVTRSEAAALAAGNPLSFLHVVRSDIDLPPSTDPHDERVYAKAKESFAYLLKEAFVQEAAPSVYLYELTLEGRSQVGVVGCLHVEDYDRGMIRKHETTRKDKEDDRTHHILTLGAHAEAVLLAHEPSPFLAQLNAKVLATPPLFDYAANEVHHRVWRAPDRDAYVDAFRRVSKTYIADGHHRTAGASRAAAERKSANPHPSGDEEYNWFLAAIFPATQLHILAYHRVVRDLGGMTPESFLSRLLTVGEVTPAGREVPEYPGTTGILLGERWFRLTLSPDATQRLSPVQALDTAQLQSRVLEPILGIGDVRSDPRIGFVGGVQGKAKLEQLVGSGEMAVGFAMYPVSIERLMQVADAGDVMPPKSTWFEPKLQSGLFVHLLD